MDLRGVKWDIVGRRPIWYAISGLVILSGLVGWVVRGLNYGIDFTGGAMYTFRVESNLAEDPVGNTAKARAAAAEAGAKAEVQVYGKNEFLIRTNTLTNDEAQEEARRLQTQLAEAFGSAELLSVELVGPVIGEQLRNNAIIAVVIGCGLILLYVTIRYELRFAVAGVMALAHDVLVTIGFCALFHKEINSPFVAAILTIVGYSINDSVIIFDRIRENWRLRGRDDAFSTVVNRSLWQTMGRSINTQITVLLTLFMIYAFGGPTIRDFAFAMLVGMFAGAYSSIFFAAPLVVDQRNWAERRASARGGRRAPIAPSVRERRQKRQAEAALDRPLVSVGNAGVSQNENDAEEQQLEEVAEGAEVAPSSRPASSQAGQQSDKKRFKAAKRGKRKKRF